MSEARLWEPLPYMRRASDFLYNTTAGGLPLEPGARKTSITLSAFSRLKAEGRASKMLVIAPKRVCHLTWPAEILKWREFEHLRCSKILGDATKREKGVNADADVYVINPENVQWLCTYLAGKPWPFDVVCIDELTRFKDQSSNRSKALRPNMKFAKRRWGLTGSLTSNGYIDVFGQQLMLDDGASLGRWVTRFREQYFTADYSGFVYTLRKGADKAIASKISPYWFEVDPSEYAQLPPLIPDPRYVVLDAKERAQYDRMEKDSVLAIDGETVAAANSAALYNKLSQLANGAIYTPTGADSKAYTVVHNAKLDGLDDLIDELNGLPLLVAYEFKHDLWRIEERLKRRYGKDYVLPCFGGGYSDKQEEAWKNAWNKNELPVMAAHPQSAGHGLNLQEGNGRHIVWFGITWSWEYYDQLIRRLRRSGNESDRIFNHMLIVPDSIDILKLTAVANKLKTHSEFMSLLAAYIKGELPMSSQVLPSGWTVPVKAPDTNGAGQSPAPTTQATVAPTAQPQAEQRQAIRDKVAAFADAKIAVPDAANKVADASKAQDLAKVKSPSTSAAPDMVRILAMLADANLKLSQVAEIIAKK